MAKNIQRGVIFKNLFGVLCVCIFQLLEGFRLPYSKKETQTMVNHLHILVLHPA